MPKNAKTHRQKIGKTKTTEVLTLSLQKWAHDSVKLLK